MPTSRQEAAQIQEIVNDFLNIKQAKEITRRLDEEVGQFSENHSLKVSLHMLRELYDA